MYSTCSPVVDEPKQETRGLVTKESLKFRVQNRQNGTHILRTVRPNQEVDHV
jgi:hypothetical protein